MIQITWKIVRTAWQHEYHALCAKLRHESRTEMNITGTTEFVAFTITVYETIDTKNS